MFTLAIAAAATLLALVLASVGGASNQATITVADVTDIGGLNDKGFNHLSYVGLQRAQKKLGIQGRVFITSTANDRKPNLQSAAQGGYGLVVAVGVLFEFGPLDDVAPAFPNTKFVGIDVDFNGLSKKPTNVRGVQFKEQEAGYLVGYIAGLEIKLHPYKHKQIVSGVGANKVPAITRFLAGYRAGAKKANRHVTVIGVDADQSFLGPHILTSATKHVDRAVYEAIAAFKANPSGFKGGFNKNYNVKNGGVGYGKLSSRLSKHDRLYISTRVNKISKLIAQ